MGTAPWRQLDDRLLTKTRVFDLRVQRLQPPNGGPEDDYYYIAARNWVNIIPITTSGEVVLVEQFRHGINQQSLETPGGIIDDDDDPEKTAVRELEEETGYVPQKVLALGVLRPNPALINNTCHVFAGIGCEPRGVQNLEPSEDITVTRVPLESLPGLIHRGEIVHTIVAAALFLLWTRHPELIASVQPGERSDR